MVTRQEGTRTVGGEIAPHSYKVETPSGTFRWNKRDIVCLPVEENPRRCWDPDPEMTSDDQVQSGGESFTPPVHPTRMSSRITSRPDYSDPCAT